MNTEKIILKCTVKKVGVIRWQEKGLSHQTISACFLRVSACM